MKATLIESHPASIKERWQMFATVVRSSYGYSIPQRTRLIIMAALYSLSFGCEACTYEVTE